MSSVRGARPVAISSSSPSTTSPPSSTTLTGPVGPSRTTDSTATPVRITAPASRRASATSSPAKGSILGSSREPRTRTVTCDPRACQAVAISQATTEPPTMISRPGACRADVASRLVQGRAPAMPGRSGTTARVPVATTTACRADSTWCSPSGLVTATLRTPKRRPWPRWTSAPMESSQSIWPWSFQSPTQ